MSYRCDVALTMLRKDYDYLREIVAGIDNEYERGAFVPNAEHEREIDGVKCMTVMWDDIKWHPEESGSWCEVVKDFLRGVYDNCEEKPYHLVVMGEELDDIDEEENGIDYSCDGGINLLPFSAKVQIARHFIMND